jgi:phospholipase/carboxylesterase
MMASPDRLVIFLHGVGASGADLAPLGELWKSTLPNTVFVAPDAPSPFDHGPGRQWFSINGVTPSNRAQRILEARRGFDDTLASVLGRYHLSGRLDQVALVGFSQGSMMALDAVVSGRWPVRAVVAFSGRLSSPEPWTPALTTRILLIHGDEDHVIPCAESRRAATVLQSLGIKAECRILQGVDHTISPQGAAMAQYFLAEAFGLDSIKV